MIRARGHDPDEWPELLAELVPIDLDALAQQTGAIRRRREIRSGSVLLRLLLGWTVAHMSLRNTVAWASESGVAHLTDEALRKRFAQCESFLRTLVAHMLSVWIDVPSSLGRLLRIVDASMCPFVGPSGRTLRVHAVYDPVAARLTSVDVTSDTIGESIAHAPHAPRDLVVADRGLAHTAKLFEVATRGVAFLVRAHLPSVSMRDAAGATLTTRALLDAARGGAREIPVWLPHKKGLLPARLAIIPMAPERAAKAREKLRKQARKKSRTPTPLTLELAGYWCLLTNLPADHADVATLCALYRLRWQIELFFKRCKSLLGLRTPPHASERLAKVGLLAYLFAAALIDGANALETPANDATIPERKLWSLWRPFRRGVIDVLVTAMHAVARTARRFQRARATASLRERPRRRTYTLQRWLENAAPTALMEDR